MKKIILTIPKRVKIVRLYTDMDKEKELKTPDIDSHKWVPMDHQKPNGEKGCDLFWIKTSDGKIERAFYCIVPLYHVGIWVERDQDVSISNVTHWYKE